MERRYAPSGIPKILLPRLPARSNAIVTAIQQDCSLLSRNATILYATLAKGPKLSREDQLNSTRLFMRELNRFGITSVVDAGGGFQNYPDDYEVVRELHHRGELTAWPTTFLLRSLSRSWATFSRGRG
jgi:predicted amidohydrolase YtcJ